jgi:hypothetical protein
MFGVTAAVFRAVDVADAGLEGLRVEYLAEDGTQRRVGLADAWAVRFEAMAPGAAVHGAEGAAASAGLPRGLLVVVDGRWSRGVRVEAGTRSRDAAGLRPGGGRVRLAAVLWWPATGGGTQPGSNNLSGGRGNEGG